MRQMKRGTASGPFATCTDAIVEMALHRTTRAATATRLYRHNLQALFQLIITAQVPTSVHQLLGSNYFLALHKDQNKLHRLRPIGIGTGLRRVAAKIALTHITDQITPLLLSGGQYGIQTPGGIDFVAQTTTNEVAKYIELPQTPTRALVCLDLHNMFNNTSRTEARQILASRPETTPLLPLYDLLTQTQTPSWFFNDKGEADKLLQDEGFPQGCPLSPLFACLVLLTVTIQINKEQLQRALRRKKAGDAHDDGKGRQAHTASIMDDTSICLPHVDLPWFLARFEELGALLGVQLNKAKTQILTTTTAITATTDGYLPTQAQQHLTDALRHLNPGNPTAAEITTGTRFLGQPVGSQAFARQYIQKRLTQMQQNVDLLTELTDLQTQSHLFRYSLVPSILHLLPTDMVLAHPSNEATTTLWDSPTTTKADGLIDAFLAKITSTPAHQITTMTTIMATLPNRLGGLGYHSPAASARPRLLTQTVRSIRLASSKDWPVPPTHKAAFTDWQHSELPWLQAFRRSIALYTHELAPAPLMNTDLYDKNTHHHLAHHTLVEHLVPSLLSATPPELLPSLPSALSPLTSLALHLPRTAEHFRIPNDLFLTALRRKLRLPVLPDHLRGKCRCPSCPTLTHRAITFFRAAWLRRRPSPMQ